MLVYAANLFLALNSLCTVRTQQYVRDRLTKSKDGFEKSSLLHLVSLGMVKTFVNLKPYCNIYTQNKNLCETLTHN